MRLILVALAVALVPGAGAQESIESLARRSVELEVSLGAFDDPVLAFSRISGLTTDRQGRIYVLQPLEGQITVLDPEGALVRRLGRKGQGPGEFAAPAGVGWVGDTLWVMDAAQRRVSYFHENRHLRTARFAPLRLALGERIAAQLPLPDESFYTIISRDFEAPAGSPQNHLPIVRVSNDGHREDTLAILQESYPFRLRIRYEGGESHGSPLFTDFPLHQIDHRGERLVIVDRPFGSRRSAEIRVNVVRSQGDTVYSRAFEVEPVPLTDAEWNARLDEALSRGNRERPYGRREVEEASARPPHWPSAQSVAIGDDGWVWLAVGSHPDQVEQRWIAIDPLGNPVFSVGLPTGFRIFHAARGRLLGVWTDGLGIPYVQRYSIRGGT